MLFIYPSMYCSGRSNMRCTGGFYLLGRSSMLLDVAITTCRYLTVYQYFVDGHLMSSVPSLLLHLVLL